MNAIAMSILLMSADANASSIASSGFMSGSAITRLRLRSRSSRSARYEPQTAKLPFYGMNAIDDSYKSGNSANTFNLPKNSGITFGGQ